MHEIAFKTCSQVDIVCHCLWEMTYYGFSNKDVKKERKKLKSNIIKSIKKEEKK